jgi:hypothetical protein
MSQVETLRRFPNADFLDFISLFMWISVADGRGRPQRRKSLFQPAFSMIRRDAPSRPPPRVLAPP